MTTLALVPSAARTTDGEVGFGGWTPDFPVFFDVNITAVSGTSPSLQLNHDVSFDGVNWVNHRQATYNATSLSRLVSESGTTGSLSRSPGLYHRLRWVITGTSPSFTFSVSAHSATEGVR